MHLIQIQGAVIPVRRSSVIDRRSRRRECEYEFFIGPEFNKVVLKLAIDPELDEDQ